jgi:tight adherence protein B
MGDMAAILILGIAAAAAVWAAFAAARNIEKLRLGDRQKIQRRLVGDSTSSAATGVERPITVELEARGVPRVLAGLGVIQRLHHKLAYVYPDASLMRLLGIMALGLFVVFVVTALVGGSLLVALLAGIAAGYAPVMLLNSRLAKLQRTLGEQLPDALDFLTRVLRAGHGLTTGLQLMGEELPEPIGGEFRKCYDRHSMGTALEACLREMAGRVGSQEFAFFVTAVIIQRQTGGDLAEVLTNISKMIRGRVRLAQHVKAITAEGRFTGNILVAFPVLLFFISFMLNPAYAGVLLKTPEGRMMLGGALLMQAVGLFFIRRIVTVRV